jgi:hypothetical protein
MLYRPRSACRHKNQWLRADLAEHSVKGTGLLARCLDQLDLWFCVSRKPIDSHYHWDAISLGVLDVAPQVADACLQKLEVLLQIRMIQWLPCHHIRAAAVHLQRPHCRHHHRTVWLELAVMHPRPAQRPNPVDNELRRTITQQNVRFARLTLLDQWVSSSMDGWTHL